MYVGVPEVRRGVRRGGYYVTVGHRISSATVHCDWYVGVPDEWYIGVYVGVAINCGTLERLGMHIQMIPSSTGYHKTWGGVG